ncbi:MAG: type II secretion system F family protein [Actinomycetota bacterium]
MKIIISIISLASTIFAIILFNYIRNLNLENIANRIERFNSNIFGKKVKKTKFIKEIEFMIQEEGTIDLGFLKIKSVENILMARIVIAGMFFIGFNIFGLAVSKNLLIYSIIGSAILYFIPVIILKRKIEDRKERINSELPDTLDIISSLVKAGLTLDESLNYVSEKRNGRIADLFNIYQIKKLEGYPKGEAFKIIARLSFSHEFKAAIKILSQSDKIGNPIGEVLKGLSRSIRDNHRDQLKIKAERLEGNLILVTFIFIFIPMLLIFLLPVYPQLKILF